MGADRARQRRGRTGLSSLADVHSRGALLARDGVYNIGGRAAFTCLANSYYELCTRSCYFTCAGLSTPAQCTAKCFEDCQCNAGYAFNGETCTPTEGCGCVRDGRYIKVNGRPVPLLAKISDAVSVRKSQGSVAMGQASGMKVLFNPSGEVMVRVSESLRAHPAGTSKGTSLTTCGCPAGGSWGTSLRSSMPGRPKTSPGVTSKQNPGC
ncbi:IgGFc-binding protein-like isoform X2 [Chrysemys picta bellii]|uniref:IgGFc-binding protein-like isoform X2 n=1 Tax=Chrysemys picta bellii TaxID=8478 RepID=UPI0032B147AA